MTETVKVIYDYKELLKLTEDIEYVNNASKMIYDSLKGKGFNQTKLQAWDDNINMSSELLDDCSLGQIPADVRYRIRYEFSLVDIKRIYHSKTKIKEYKDNDDWNCRR